MLTYKHLWELGFTDTLFISYASYLIINGPPSEPVLFCLSVGVVCRLSGSVTLPAGGPAGRRERRQSGGRHCTAGQYSYVSLGQHFVYLRGCLLIYLFLFDIIMTVIISLRRR